MAYDNGSAGQLGQLTAMPRAASTRMPGSIAAQVDVQAEKISELEKAFEELSERLRPVLSNHPRADSIHDNGVKQAMPCDLAGALATNADRVGTVIARMTDLIGRIEL